MVLGVCSGLVHRMQASHLHRVRRGKNKQTMEEGGLEDGKLDRAPVDDEVEDTRRWKSGACARHALLLGSMR